MFIEKVTECDVENFLWKFRLEVDEFTHYGKEIFVKTADDYFGNTVCDFMLTDFGCRNVFGCLRGHEKQVTKVWRDSMKQKFGKEYKIALKNYLKENVNN